jgi:hypothetical protein
VVSRPLVSWSTCKHVKVGNERQLRSKDGPIDVELDIVGVTFIVVEVEVVRVPD